MTEHTPDTRVTTLPADFHPSRELIALLRYYAGGRKGAYTPAMDDAVDGAMELGLITDDAPEVSDAALTLLGGAVLEDAPLMLDLPGDTLAATAVLLPDFHPRARQVTFGTGTVTINTRMLTNGDHFPVRVEMTPAEARQLARDLLSNADPAEDSIGWQKKELSCRCCAGSVNSEGHNPDVCRALTSRERTDIGLGITGL